MEPAGLDDHRLSGAGDARARTAPRAAAAAFAAMLAVYFFSYFQRAAIPGTIFNDLQRDLGLSAAAVAGMGSMFTWIYGGMQVVVGLLVDRYGGARMLLAGGLAMLAGSALFPLAHTVGWLFAARVLTGLGSSFMFLCIVREISRLFGAGRFAMWMGVVLGVGYCGGMTATLPFERAAAAWGWRASLLGVAALLAVALAAAALVLRRAVAPPPPAGGRHLAPLLAILAARASRPLLASSLLLFPVYFVIQTVLGKKFLQDFAGFSSPAASGVILAMTALSIGCTVAGGMLPRWLGERRRPCLLAGASLLLLATLVLLGGTIVGAGGGAFLAGYLLLAATGLAQPAGLATMKELSPPEATAASIAVMNGLAYLGAGTIGQLGGVILERYRDAAIAGPAGPVYPREAYAALFAFLVLVALANLALVALVPETRGRQAGGAAAPGSDAPAP